MRLVFPLKNSTSSLSLFLRQDWVLMPPNRLYQQVLEMVACFEHQQLLLCIRIKKNSLMSRFELS